MWDILRNQNEQELAMGSCIPVVRAHDKHLAGLAGPKIARNKKVQTKPSNKKTSWII
jgi:hypothetical protein